MNDKFRPGDYVLDVFPFRRGGKGQVTSNKSYPVVKIWWFINKESAEYHIDNIVRTND